MTRTLYILLTAHFLASGRMMKFYALLLFVTLSGCTTARQQSPLGEMMALTAKGEVACVRMGVLVRGREGCR